MSNKVPTLPCFSFHTVITCLFHGLFSVTFFAYLCFKSFSFLKGDFTIKKASQSNEALSSVLKCNMAMMCLTENIYMFTKLHSNMSYRAIDCEFNVNKPTMYIYIYIK